MSLLKMSISGAVLILVIIVLRSVFINRLPKKTFLFLWGGALLRLLLPFSFPSVFSAYSLINRSILIRENIMGTTTNTMLTIAGTNPVTNHNYVSVFPQNATSVSIWFVIWCVGMTICAIFFIVTYIRCRKEFQMSLPISNNIVEKWIKEHQIKRTISIRQSSRIVAPLTYGIVHPVILMPKNTNWGNMQQLQYVLLHEYVHIRRYDTAIKLISVLALCVHWFNPLVWAMYILFNRDIELSCDEQVVRSFGETSKSAYAQTLISMEEQKSSLTPLCNNFSKNAIEERITSIMKIKKTSILTMLIAAMLVVAITTAFGTSALASITENETAIQNTDFADKESYNEIQEGDKTVINNTNKSTSQNKTISVEQLSLQPGSHENYGHYFFKKGDIISVDINWNEQGNVYFAIGKEFGSFRGLESSGRDSTSFNTSLEVMEDGEYYIFLGIQGTQDKGVDGINGEIVYPLNLE